jgi:hypothetical protein
VAAGLVGPADAKPGNGHANGHGKGHCRGFHALGTGTDNGDGTTTATIYRGSHEFGTTEGTLTAGVPDADGVAAFAGTIVFTNTEATGTLTAPVVGAFSIVSGEFTATSSTVTGAGDFVDVTGKLRIRGTQDLTDNTFTEHLYAKLCVPKKKQH